MRTHNKLDWFSRLIAFFSKDYLVVPRYTIRYYLNKINLYEKAYNSKKELYDDCVKNWGETLKHNDTLIKDLENEYKRFDNVLSITTKIIDSLVGELVMRGVDYEEIKKMFPNTYSYDDFLDIKENYVK